MGLLTRAVVQAEGDDLLGGSGISTILVGTVTNTPGELLFGAEALGISQSATELGSLSKHVLDADLLK